MSVCIDPVHKFELIKTVDDDLETMLRNYLSQRYGDTNVEYISLYYSNRQTENYLNAMVVQVRMTEGFDTEKQWAFLGQIQDPLLRTPWQYEVRYGGNEPAEMMINRGTRYDWFLHYFGYSIPMADEQTIAELWEQEEVKQMPSWPNEGSVKVIGDVVVIKCGENP